MSSDGQFLDEAASIGRTIVADSVWHDGRCSWIGAAADAPGSTGVEYQALGADLYGGTAGVGLFLAQIANATGDESFRRTAVGALLHATARASELRLGRRDGFHAGSLGVAWATATAAELLDVEELLPGARTLAAERPAPDGRDRCADVVMGMAGCILGLLSLAEHLDDPRLAEEALATGEVLLRQATVTSNGWSWATPGRRYRHHLCGASHGAAGIGWALLELFAATGDERFRAGATGAFAYERSWLDPVAGRWPDLRIAGQRRGPLAPIDSGIAGTWCYGEAGIALTRLRAVDLLGPGPHNGDAELALDTTYRHLADGLPFAIDDLSLCHGMAGAADALLSAAALQGRWCHAADLVTQLGDVVLERYADTGRSWPCGTAGETTPGLFLGMSGIGWLLLRLHDQATPSPLGPNASLDRRARST